MERKVHELEQLPINDTVDIKTNHVINHSALCGHVMAISFRTQRLEGRPNATQTTHTSPSAATITFTPTSPTSAADIVHSWRSQRVFITTYPQFTNRFYTSLPSRPPALLPMTNLAATSSPPGSVRLSDFQSARRQHWHTAGRFGRFQAVFSRQFVGCLCFWTGVSAAVTGH